VQEGEVRDLVLPIFAIKKDSNQDHVLGGLFGTPANLFSSEL
jgi:hypothetical protein